MMEAVFIKILNMSVTAGIIIIAVILIRFLLRRVPKIFSYTLWLAVLFRLLCPVTFSSDFSVLSLFQAPVTDQGEVSYFSDTVYSSGVTETSEAVFIKAPADSVPFISGIDSPSLSGHSRTFLLTGICIWLSGFFIMVSYSLLSYLRVNRSLKSARKEQDNIYSAAGLTVPFVCGFEELLIRVPILSVNATNIEIELSVQETQLFLSEQESGFTYASVPPAE